MGLPQIRGDCGWEASSGSVFSSSSSSVFSPNSYQDYTAGSAGDQGSSAGYSGGAPGRTNAENDGPIRNGQRHPLCGGEYLNECDLGPFLPSDVGDGSCQQHLNSEGCHYDGGKFLLADYNTSICCIEVTNWDRSPSLSTLLTLEPLPPTKPVPDGCRTTGDCCSTSCEWATTDDTRYICQGSELDPYFCRDPKYAIDIQSALQSQTSAATTTRPFSRSIWRSSMGSHEHVGRARGGSWGAPAGVRGGGVLASLVVTMLMIIASRNTMTAF